MDATRTSYVAPAVVSEGAIEQLTKVNLPPFTNDTNFTGKRQAEGSVGFAL